MDNKTSKGAVVGKVFLSLLVIFVSFVVFGIVSLLVIFDGNWNTIIKNILVFLIPLLIIISIWNKKFRHKLFIATIISIIVFICNAYYYENISNKIEPLFYLHNKYNFDYSDMKVIETSKRTTGDILGQGSTSRGAVVKYKDYNIDVYYRREWLDNYGNKKEYESKSNAIEILFRTTIKKYTENFKIINDPQLHEDSEQYDYYGYTDYAFIIYLYIEDAEALDNIIKELDDYVANDQSRYLIYGLYVVKDKKVFDDLVNTDLTKLSTVYTGISGQTYATEVFDIAGYDAKRISYSDYFNKDMFVNNGDVNHKEYQDISNYDYVAFWYSAERNSFAGLNTPEFQIFGIKKTNN